MMLGLLVLVTVGSQGFAATVSDQTEADVTFEAGDTPTTPTKPDTKEPIIPDETFGPASTDNVHLMHAPSFHFGSVKINPAGEEYPGKEAKFTNATAEEYYMPDFIQVTDVSGSTTTKWEVTVAQDLALTSTTNKLDNARIRLYGQTLTNMTKDLTAGTDIKGFTLGAGGFGEIPLAADGSLKVLSSETAGFTNNSTTTNVLQNNYQEANFGPGLTDTQSANSDVKLSVTEFDSPNKGETYSADLTWTLSVTP